MNRKTLLKGCAAAWAVCALLAVGFFFVAGEQLFFRDEQTDMLRADMPIGELTAETEVRQRFVADADALRGVELLLSTYGRVNETALEVRIEDAEGTVIGQTSVLTAALADNSPVRLDFEKPLPLAHAAPYDLVLTASGAAQGNAVTAWYGTGVSAGRAAVLVPLEAWEYVRVNGEPAGGKLCCRLYTRSDLWVGPAYWYLAAGALLALLAYCAYMLVRWEKGKPTRLLRLVLAMKKYNYLLRQLVSRDFKTKYKRSVLGIFWSFLNPLLSMAVQYIVFSTLFRSDIPNFALYLLIGIVCFGSFSEITNMSLTSIVGNASLINKVYVPKYIYPLSRVLSSMVNLLFSLIPLFLVMLLTHTPLRPSVLLLPFGLLCLMAFCTGMGLLLSASMVFFRDTQFLWGVLSMVWMYATPIFYPESIIPAQFMTLYKCNPLYHIVRFLRTVVIDGVSPEPKAYLLCAIACAVPLLAGAWVFKRSQDRFVLYL